MIRRVLRPTIPPSVTTAPQPRRTWRRRLLRSLVAVVGLMLIVVGIYLAYNYFFVLVRTDPAALAKLRDEVAWLEQNTVPLQSVRPGADDDDLQPLSPMFADVRIVGLGEATHGTKEFNTMRHRLFEFLVREHGFRVFILEDGFGNVARINDYVLRGTGSARDALRGLETWPWQTKEHEALIEWMRAYNIEHPDDPVRCYGADMQSYSDSLRLLTDFTQVHLPQVAPQVGQLSDALGRLDNSTPETYRTIRDEIYATVQAIREVYTQNQASLQAATSPQEYNATLLHLRVAEQYAAHYDPQTAAVEGIGSFLRNALFPPQTDVDPTIELRDQFMAENIATILGFERPDNKAVWWAHNGHVGMTLVNKTYAGGYLRQQFGAAYYALGFQYFQGGFQAIGTDAQLQEFYHQRSDEGSLAYRFARLAEPYTFLNFRNLAQGQPEWLWQSQPWNHIGAVAFPTRQPGYLGTQIVPPADFDGLIYIHNTSRAEPVEGFDAFPIKN